MGSRGYQRQFRKIRAQHRVLVRAYFLAHPAPPPIPPVEDRRFPGLAGLLDTRVWRPYPFGDGWVPSVTGTVGGLSRVGRPVLSPPIIDPRRAAFWRS